MAKPQKDPAVPSNVSSDKLKSYLSRIERLEEEAMNIRNDVKEIFLEAKANGFDIRTMKTIIRLKKMDAAEREEQELLLETYIDALGGI